jgi:hypothetical protein
MPIVPQTLSTEVAEAINALISASDRFRNSNDLEVQAIVRKIEKLQKVDARDAFVRFGSLAAICGNLDDMFTYYHKALLLPGELETKHEFFASLGNAGMYSKAQDICSWLLDPKRGFFPRIWQRAVSIGKVLEVWDRLADAKKTYPDLSDADFSIVEEAVDVMRSHGLRDQDIASMLDLMGEVQRTHRIMFSGTPASKLKVIRPPEDPAYLYFAMPLDTGFDEVHTMNREFARLVVEKLPDGSFPRGLVATFAKAHPVELRVAA